MDSATDIVLDLLGRALLAVIIAACSVVAAVIAAPFALAALAAYWLGLWR
jgi:hypothetical protein